MATKHAADWKAQRRWRALQLKREGWMQQESGQRPGSRSLVLGRRTNIVVHLNTRYWRAKQAPGGEWTVENAGPDRNSADAEYEFQPALDGTWGVIATVSSPRL